MFEVGASVICTVIVLNFHHRNAEAYFPMPKLMRIILLDWVAWILYMKRPSRVRVGDEETQKWTSIKRNGSIRMGRILVPTVDVDTRLFSNPNTYSQMQNGCAKIGRNGYMSSGDAEDMDLHVKNCSNKRRESFSTETIKAFFKTFSNYKA